MWATRRCGWAALRQLLTPPHAAGVRAAPRLPLRAHSTGMPIGALPPAERLFISFSCRPCKHIVQKTVSKLAYERGVVLIQCPQCEVRHMIADNLNWFGEGRRNIEDIVREQGQTVRRVVEGEYVPTGADPEK